MRQLTNSEAVALLVHGYDRYLNDGAIPIDPALFPEGTAATVEEDDTPPAAGEPPDRFVGWFGRTGILTPLCHLAKLARHRDGTTLSIVHGAPVEGWFHALLDERPGAAAILAACGWPGPVGHMFPEFLPAPILAGNESTEQLAQESSQLGRHAFLAAGPDKVGYLAATPTAVPTFNESVARTTADALTAAERFWESSRPEEGGGTANSVAAPASPVADRLSRSVDVSGLLLSGHGRLSAHSASLLVAQLVACIRRLTLPTEGFAWDDTNDGFGCRVGSYLAALDLGLYACMLALPVVHLEGGREVRAFAFLELVAATEVDGGGWRVTIFDPSIEPVQGRPLSTLEPELLDAQALAAEEVRAILTRAGVAC